MVSKIKMGRPDASPQARHRAMTNEGLEQNDLPLSVPRSKPAAACRKAIVADEAHPFEEGLKRRRMRGIDNRRDVSIRPDQNPLARRETISIAEIALVVGEIAARADCMDVQTGARRNSGKAICAVSEQRPMWPLKQFE